MHHLFPPANEVVLGAIDEVMHEHPAAHGTKGLQIVQDACEIMDLLASTPETMHG